MQVKPLGFFFDKKCCHNVSGCFSSFCSFSLKQQNITELKNQRCAKRHCWFTWNHLFYLFDEIAQENIHGHDKYKKYMPYLLTVFFFILFGNLLGLIPFLSNPNMTGSISVTLLLAMITFIIQLASSKGAFWGHIFAPPGVPKALYVILVPIEFLGIFIKPAALTIRLFANITAGHIIVVSLISIIFVTKNLAWAGLSVPMTLFISILELLVAFLQAYIFTMLSALFIGTAAEEGHHH
jgi:F-type H+-transporting ATPase subunit a